jgi:hypothetical protein
VRLLELWRLLDAAADWPLDLGTVEESSVAVRAGGGAGKPLSRCRCRLPDWAA